MIALAFRQDQLEQRTQSWRSRGFGRRQVISGAAPIGGTPQGAAAMKKCRRQGLLREPPFASFASSHPLIRFGFSHELELVVPVKSEGTAPALVQTRSSWGHRSESRSRRTKRASHRCSGEKFAHVQSHCSKAMLRDNA